MRDQLDIRTITLQQVLKLLGALGAQYRIIMPEGDSYGTLEVITEPVRPKKGSRYGWGSLRAYYRPLIEAMEVGEDIIVPVDRFDMLSLATGISDLVASKWGKGNGKVNQREDLNAVQVMRYE